MDDFNRCLRANAKLSARSRELYLENLNRFAAWLDEQHTSWADVTEDQIYDYLDLRGWSSSTKNSALCAIKCFVRWKFGKRHPANYVHVHRDDAGPQRTPEKETIEQLISQFDTTTPKGARDLALIMLLLDTGLRAAEVCALTVKFTNMERHEVRVRTKGGKWRAGVFFDYTTSCLAAWLAMRPKVARDDCETLFCSIGGTKPGTALTRCGLRSVFRRLTVGKGMDLLSPHDFRRAFATLATDIGAPSVTVQKAGRWSSISMVERYTRKLEAHALRPWSPANYVMGIRVDGDGVAC